MSQLTDQELNQIRADAKRQYPMLSNMPESFRERQSVRQDAYIAAATLYQERINGLLEALAAGWNWVASSERLPVGKVPAVNTYMARPGFLECQKDGCVFTYGESGELNYSFGDDMLYEHFIWLNNESLKG